MDSSDDSVKTGNTNNPLVDLIFDGDKANRLLLGNLVRILANKGILNLDEYIEEVQGLKNHITTELGRNDDDGDIIARSFDLHINDFNKPE